MDLNSNYFIINNTCFPIDQKGNSHKKLTCFAKWRQTHRTVNARFCNCAVETVQLDTQIGPC